MNDLDTRLATIWTKITRNSRETSELKQRVRVTEKRLDRLEGRVKDILEKPFVTTGNRSSEE